MGNDDSTAAVNSAAEANSTLEANSTAPTGGGAGIESWLFLLAPTLLLLPGLFFAHHYLSHGLFATYSAGLDGQDGRMVRVAQTVESRVQFPTRYRALSRIVEAWDYDHYGIPTRFPRFAIHLAGALDLPGHQSRRLRLVSPNQTELWVDGERVAGPVSLARGLWVPGQGAATPEPAPTPEPTVFEPGEHALVVRWSGQFRLDRTHRSHSSLAIEYEEDGIWQPVPASWLTPSYGDSIAWRVYAGLLAGWLLLSLLAAFALRSGPKTRRRLWSAGLLFVILALGLGLRLFDYQVMPHFTENGDELFATWNGWQLLTDGTTRGWSLWPHFYGARVQHETLPYWNSEGGGWHLIQPYFEHPPLAHLLVGALGKLSGAAHFAHCRLTYTRLAPIALSMLTMVLMFLIGRRLRPRGAGPYLGILLYAVIPLIVLQNRAIKEEFLLAPMALASLYCFLRWRDDTNHGRGWLVIAGLLAGGSAMAKVSGAVYVPALILMVLSSPRPKDVWIAALAGFAGVGFLFLYGAALDWDVFLLTTAKQATGRPSHWNLFPRFFADGLIVHNFLGRAPTLFLWFGYVAFLGGRGRRVDPAWVIFPLVYFISMTLSAGNWMFGWYILPIYPFLCLGAGEFLAELWERPSPLYGMLFVALLVTFGMNFLETPEYFKRADVWLESRRQVTLLVMGLIAPHFAAYVLQWPMLKKLSRASTAISLALVVILSAYFVTHYDVIYQTHRDFGRDQFFDR